MVPIRRLDSLLADGVIPRAVCIKIDVESTTSMRSRTHDPPVERKRQLLSPLHVIVERWRAFMAEIASLFAAPQSDN
jgi:hypothetical protein